MFSYIFLQIFSILAIGDILSKFLGLQQSEENETYMTSRLIYAILLGYASIVLPVVIIAVFLNIRLGIIFFIHFIFGLSLSLYYLYQLIINFQELSFPKLTTLLGRDPLDLGILIFILGYLFISFLYPIRGWDALHFYIPNGFYFYLVEDIPPGVNPLSFFPTFKPPVNSVTFMYGFFISRTFTGNLHPWIFLLGSAAVVYNLGMTYFENIQQSKMAVLTFFALPITYVLVYEYAYYQELPLMFFYSTAMYFLLKLDTKSMTHNFITGIAIAMAMLSKISGYSLLIVIPLVILFHHKSKLLRYLFTIVLFLFLTRKAIYSTYYLMAIPIIVTLIYTLYQQYRQLHYKQYNFSLKSFFGLLLLPAIFGTTWVLFMLKIPNIREKLTNTYVYVTSKTLQLNFNTVDAYSIYLENGMRVSFLSSTLYIFIGSLIGIGVSILILAGLKYSHPDILIWFSSFWTIWYAYHGTVSARYLVPIIAPLIIIIISGYSKIMMTLNINYGSKWALNLLLLSLGTSFVSVFPLFPVRYLVKVPNLRFYGYHQNLVLLFTYLLLISIFLIYLASSTFGKNILRKQVTTYFLIGLLCFGPFAAQIGVYSYTGFDQEETQQYLNYYHRENYQSMISFLNNENIDPTHRLISVNTPGLEYFISRAVLDLIIFQGLENFSRSHLDGNPETIRDKLIEFSFYYLISLNSSHVGYRTFEANYASLEVYQMSGNTTYFSNIFNNPEFSVYRLV